MIKTDQRTIKKLLSPDRVIAQKGKLKREKLNDIKSTDAMFKNLCYDNQNIILQRERLYVEAVREPGKVNAQAIAEKKAEMNKILNENNDIVKTGEELKKLKKKELNKKLKKVSTNLLQTKFVETIQIKIPIQCC